MPVRPLIAIGKVARLRDFERRSTIIQLWISRLNLIYIRNAHLPLVRTAYRVRKTFQNETSGESFGEYMLRFKDEYRAGITRQLLGKLPSDSKAITH